MGTTARRGDTATGVEGLREKSCIKILGQGKKERRGDERIAGKGRERERERRE